MDTRTVTDLFHELAPAIIRLVEKDRKANRIARHKGTNGDYATQVDVDTENYIVSEIRKYFPEDKILAEESYSDTEISADRIWIIDPICGTGNLGKGINDFCTNIALSDNGQVIAACVVDHSQGQYIWSVGGGKIYVNSEPYSAPPPEMGIKIDVDFSGTRNADMSIQLKHISAVRKLIEGTNYSIASLNSSLGFAYTAIGKMDGFINVFNRPWDIAAASYLVQQAGGVITAADGSPWTVYSVGAIGARTPEIHKVLLDSYLSS
jgi:myo-inositol-1(or 4)-monophosphatase